MNPYLPLGLFALSAPFGLFLAVRHLRGGEAPLGAAVAHALFGAAGLAALAAASAAAGWSGKTFVALCVLAAAAVGGFVLASSRLRATRPAAFLIVVHALVAVSGVAVLAVAVLGR